MRVCVCVWGGGDCAGHCRAAAPQRHCARGARGGRWPIRRRPPVAMAGWTAPSTDEASPPHTVRRVTSAARGKKARGLPLALALVGCAVGGRCADAAPARAAVARVHAGELYESLHRAAASVDASSNPATARVPLAGGAAAAVLRGVTARSAGLARAFPAAVVTDEDGSETAIALRSRCFSARTTALVVDASTGEHVECTPGGAAEQGEGGDGVDDGSSAFLCGTPSYMHGYVECAGRRFAITAGGSSSADAGAAARAAPSEAGARDIGGSLRARGVETVAVELAGTAGDDHSADAATIGGVAAAEATPRDSKSQHPFALESLDEDEELAELPASAQGARGGGGASARKLLYINATALAADAALAAPPKAVENYELTRPMVEQLIEAADGATGCLSVAVDTTPELVWQSPWDGDADALAEYLVSLYTYASYILSRDAGVGISLVHLRVNKNVNTSPYAGSCETLGATGMGALLEQVVPVWDERRAKDKSLPDAHLVQLVTGRMKDGGNCGGRATTYVGTLVPPKESTPMNAVCMQKRRSVVSLTSSWAGLPQLHDGTGGGATATTALEEARAGTDGDASELSGELYSTVGDWDAMVVVHELLHNLGSAHTHDCTFYDPPLDLCGASSSGGECGAKECSTGSIMSYCHLCGLNSVRLGLHPRVASVVRRALAPGGVGCAACVGPPMGSLELLDAAELDGAHHSDDAFVGFTLAGDHQAPTTNTSAPASPAPAPAPAPTPAPRSDAADPTDTLGWELEVSAAAPLPAPSPYLELEVSAAAAPVPAPSPVGSDATTTTDAGVLLARAWLVG